MSIRSDELRTELGVIPAADELPVFQAGEQVRIVERWPIGHYRVPIYLRGKPGIVLGAIEPTLIDNEEEGFGRNAGSRRHYYRVALSMTDLWASYAGRKGDELRLEVFETWLERI